MDQRFAVSIRPGAAPLPRPSCADGGPVTASTAHGNAETGIVAGQAIASAASKNNVGFAADHVEASAAWANTIGIDIGDARLGIGFIITAIVSFLSIAAVLFMLVKAYNRVINAADDDGPSDNDLLVEIRDLLSR